MRIKDMAEQAQDLSLCASLAYLQFVTQVVVSLLDIPKQRTKAA